MTSGNVNQHFFIETARMKPDKMTQNRQAMKINTCHSGYEIVLNA